VKDDPKVVSHFGFILRHFEQAKIQTEVPEYVDSFPTGGLLSVLRTF
jgi:hypothetical protein